jgi:23S rRNA (cytosine1962-C5)-methyltransferase
MSAERDYHQAFLKRASLREQKDLHCYRLYHGFCEKPDHPHPLSIDRYGPAFLIKTYREGIDISAAVAALREHFGAALAIVHKEVFRRASLAAMAGSLISGDLPEALVVEEHGRLYSVSLLGQRNTGIFLEARAIRDDIQGRCRGKTVLNLFSYTGAFAIAALKGGARQVINIDSNRNVHKRAQGNYRLNKLAVDERDFVTARFDEALRFYKKKKQSFEVIVFDPPPASRQGRKRFRSRRDYMKCFGQLLAILAPRSLCYALCNDRDLLIDERFFGDKILQVSKGQSTTGEIKALLKRAADFPSSKAESRLRGILFSC